MTDNASNKSNKILTFDEFITEHRRKVSLWTGPVVGLSMFIIALIHKQLIKKQVNVVITSIIAFIAIDSQRSWKHMTDLIMR